MIGGFLIGIDLDIGVQNGWRSKFLCHSREVTYYLHWHGGGLSTKVSRVSVVGKMHHLQSCGSVCMYMSFIYSFVCCDSLNNLPFIWTARVLCKCDECRGLVKPVKPSEWERHTGCRKKKWKESIRVKNLDQPLVQWVSSFWMNCIILENLIKNI